MIVKNNKMQNDIIIDCPSTDFIIKQIDDTLWVCEVRKSKRNRNSFFIEKIFFFFLSKPLIDRVLFPFWACKFRIEWQFFFASLTTWFCIHLLEIFKSFQPWNNCVLYCFFFLHCHFWIFFCPDFHLIPCPLLHQMPIITYLLMLLSMCFLKLLSFHRQLFQNGSKKWRKEKTFFILTFFSANGAILLNSPILLLMNVLKISCFVV